MSEMAVSGIKTKTYGDEMMLHFPCKNNATEVINFLHEKGHKIVIATARSTNWHTKPKEITLEWLKINNIPFDKFYYARNDKEQICIEEKVDVFVDDDITITAKVAEQFANQPNKYVFLPTTNYNKDLKENENVIRINSLNDIIKILNLQ